ncbi:MAG: PHP domain-containing protein, partial [Verrucomicrobiota bacterium]
ECGCVRNLLQTARSGKSLSVFLLLVLMILIDSIVGARLACHSWNARAFGVKLGMPIMSTKEEEDSIKVDLHIHTVDDPKDVIDYSAHQLLERARGLGFGVLAITLHDAVFDRTEVFADAASMGILLIPAAEVRLQGADVIVLNVTADEVRQLKDFDDLRQLRVRRGSSIFTIAPHPFYVLGGSIGGRLFDEIDCFDAIEFCHFHHRLLNPNRRAKKVAAKYGKPLIATSDAHRLPAFGRHYTSILRPVVMTAETVFATLRTGPLRLTSPAASIVDLLNAIYFIFLAHPFRTWRHRRKQGAGAVDLDRLGHCGRPPLPARRS